MIPATFHEKEQVISPPKGMHEHISGLRVVTMSYQGGDRAMVSCWEPTPEEIEQIVAHKRIYLAVMGTEHPPVVIVADPKKLGLDGCL